MGVEPQEFQCPTPGRPAQAAPDPAGSDPSLVRVGAGDRISGACRASIDNDASPKGERTAAGDPGRNWVATPLSLFGRAREILRRLKVSAPLRWSGIAGALAVSFGLGFACAAIFTSGPGVSLAALDHRDAAMPAVPVALNCEKRPVRPRRRLARASGEPTKPKLPQTAARASAQAQHAEPQSVIMQGMERISSQGERPAVDSNSPPPLSPFPETKPATIAGWSVREVNGETAVLAGPDRVFTVRTGDSVPGVGRIDSIVRWGNRWIVATAKGLISTE